MDIINNNQLKLYIYKIIQHTKKKKGIEYLFVGDINKTIKMIINKLVSNNKLNKDEEEKLEEIYMNVDLLKKSIEKNREINLIYKTIYEDDNIFFLKNKLVNYINKDLNSEHIYLWYKKSISDYRWTTWLWKDIISIHSSNIRKSRNDVVCFPCRVDLYDTCIGKFGFENRHYAHSYVC